MHEALVNRLGGLSLPRKSAVRLTDRADMTLDVYRGRKTTAQPNNNTYTTHIYVGSWVEVRGRSGKVFKDHKVSTEVSVSDQTLKIPDT